MDLLKIKDKTAYLCLPGSEEKVVSQVTTEDIEAALEVLIASPDVEIAIDEDSSAIAHPAQKIVFEQLRASFKEVQESREVIISEADETFAQAESKYLCSDK